MTKQKKPKNPEVNTFLSNIELKPTSLEPRMASSASVNTGLYHNVSFHREDPAGYVDGLNLYAAYFDVNGVDPDGLTVYYDSKVITYGNKQYRYGYDDAKPSRGWQIYNADGSAYSWLAHGRITTDYAGPSSLPIEVQIDNSGGSVLAGMKSSLDKNIPSLLQKLELEILENNTRSGSDQPILIYSTENQWFNLETQ